MYRGWYFGCDGLVDGQSSGVVLGRLAMLALPLFHISLCGLLLLPLSIPRLSVPGVTFAKLTLTVET